MSDTPQAVVHGFETIVLVTGDGPRPVATPRAEVVVPVGGVTPDDFRGEGE